MKRKTINPAADKIAAGIVGKTIQLQTRWANFMQRKVDRLSVKSQKYLLIIFSVLTVTYSCCIIIQSFTRGDKATISITAIRMPKHVIEEKKANISLMSDKEYNRIENYKKYMDSCGLQVRPGLADSIRQIEIIYQSSKK